MAEVTVTVANVIPQANAVIASGTAGIAITAGQPVYADATDGNKIKVATTATAAGAAVVGISVNSAPGVGQPVDYVVSGDLAFGAGALVSRTVYVLSSPGKLGTTADQGASEYGTVLGISTNTSILKVGITASGVNA